VKIAEQIIERLEDIKNQNISYADLIKHDDPIYTKEMEKTNINIDNIIKMIREEFT